jgi:hypothetical protein
MRCASSRRRDSATAPAVRRYDPAWPHRGQSVKATIEGPGQRRPSSRHDHQGQRCLVKSTQCRTDYFKAPH